MTNPLDAMVDKATADAQNAAAATPAVAPVGQTPAAAPAVGGGVMSTTALMAASFSPDAWLGVDKGFYTVGKDPTEYKDPLEVTIDLSDIKNVTVYRYDNPAKYIKTYDGVYTNTGESWAAKLAEAKQIDPNGVMYGSIDLPMYFAQEIGEFGPGEVVGYSLPVTGREEFLKLLKSVARAGHMVEGMGAVTIKTTITAEKRVNSKAPKGFGVINFGPWELVAQD